MKLDMCRQMRQHRPSGPVPLFFVQGKAAITAPRCLRVNGHMGVHVAGSGEAWTGTAIISLPNPGSLALTAEKAEMWGQHLDREPILNRIVRASFELVATRSALDVMLNHTCDCAGHGKN